MNYKCGKNRKSNDADDPSHARIEANQIVELWMVRLGVPMNK